MEVELAVRDHYAPPRRALHLQVGLSQCCCPLRVELGKKLLLACVFSLVEVTHVSHLGGSNTLRVPVQVWLLLSRGFLLMDCWHPPLSEPP